MRSLLLAMCLVLALHCCEADISCNTVNPVMLNCVDYLLGGGNVTFGCCNAIATVNDSNQPPEDRKEVCNCTINAIESICSTSQQFANALDLPAKCCLDLPYKFSPSTDCNNIDWGSGKKS